MAGSVERPGLTDEADRSAHRATHIAATEGPIRAGTTEETPIPPAVPTAQTKDGSTQARAEDAARIEALETFARSLEQRLAEAEGQMADHAYRVLTARLERQRFAATAADARAAVEAARAEAEAAHEAARDECGRLKSRIRHQDQALKAILASRSWRAMEPVRKFTRFARRVYLSARVRLSAGAKAEAPDIRALPGAIVQWIRRGVLRRPA